MRPSLARGTPHSLGRFRGAVDVACPPAYEWLRSASVGMGCPLSPVDFDDTFPDPGFRLHLAGCQSGSGLRFFPHLAIIADVQLHVRQDLIRRLGLDSQATSFDDSNLLLASYEKWGTACGEYLLGEFAFAIWDGRKQRLFCCRDQMGFRPFLYWRDETRLVFAGDIRAILAVPGVPVKLNARKMSGTAIWGGHTLHQEDTFHLGIQALPPGSWLSFDRSGHRQGKYWEPRISRGLVPRKPADVFAALRDLLSSAVECRIQGASSVATELSGGLDSSAVTSIAARYLARDGRSILALSAVAQGAGRGPLGDEREFIEEFRCWPNVDIKYIEAEGRGPFDTIEDPGCFIVSPLRTSRFYLYEAFERAAVDSGVSIVLQGNMGEMGPTAYGVYHYTELAAGLRLPTMIRDLRLLHKIQGLNPVRFLAGRFLDLVRPFPGRQPRHVLLNSAFRRNGDTRTSFGYPQRSLAGYHLAMLGVWLRHHASRRGQTARGYVRTTEPLLDIRVLEFCLSMPSEMFVRNGYLRYPVRAALDGILPKRIQWRTDKVAFSTDYFVRFNAQLGKAREFVAAIGRTDPVRSVIDVDRLATLLTPVAPDSRSPIARDVVPATIYAICFLRQFPEYRP